MISARALLKLAMPLKAKSRLLCPKATKHFTLAALHCQATISGKRQDLDISKGICEVGSAPEGQKQAVVPPGHQALHIGSLAAHELHVINPHQLHTNVLGQLLHLPAL